MPFVSSNSIDISSNHYFSLVKSHPLFIFKELTKEGEKKCGMKKGGQSFGRQIKKAMDLKRQRTGSRRRDDQA